MSIKYRIGIDGTIALPPDYLKNIGVRPGGEVIIACSRRKISIQKAPLCCVFCGGEKALAPFKTCHLCADCQKELAALEN